MGRLLSKFMYQNKKKPTYVYWGISGSSRKVVANVLDYNIVESKFELLS